MFQFNKKTRKTRKFDLYLFRVYEFFFVWREITRFNQNKSK